MGFSNWKMASVFILFVSNIANGSEMETKKILAPCFLQFFPQVEYLNLE